MNYSIKYNEYYIELWLTPKTEFLIFQHSNTFVVDSFPQFVNPLGTLMNIILESKPRETTPLILSPCPHLVYVFQSAGHSLEKVINLNEDAYFCTDRVIGIADGVGSFKKDFGISSREFSNELMLRCEKFVKNTYNKKISCRSVINEAYSKVESGGGATFILASIFGHQLNVLNLGDCGLILIRYDGDYKIVFQTTAKMHCFNTPYQLARRFSLEQMKRNMNGVYDIGATDDINDADEFLITLLPNDFIIMGSDGLWDNVYPQEVIELLRHYKNESFERIARIISNFAKMKTVGNTVTPFSKSYGKNMQKGNCFVGGKTDDITVLVAKICLGNN